MALATIYPFLTRSYTAAIYLDGTKRFTERDGVAGIHISYHESVKQYAAATYTVAPYAMQENQLVQMAEALTKGYINQQEYEETTALALTK